MYFLWVLNLYNILPQPFIRSFVWWVFGRLLIFVSILTTSGVSGDCIFPVDMPPALYKDDGLTPVASAVEQSVHSTYKTDEFLLYKCDRTKGGFGTVEIYCQSDGEWSEIPRKCSGKCTVKPVFKTTWEIGTPWELRTAISVPISIQYIEMDLGNKTTSELRTDFHSLLGVPNSQVSL